MSLSVSVFWMFKQLLSSPLCPDPMCQALCWEPHPPMCDPPRREAEARVTQPRDPLWPLPAPRAARLVPAFLAPGPHLEGRRVRSPCYQAASCPRCPRTLVLTRRPPPRALQLRLLQTVVAHKSEAVTLGRVAGKGASPRPPHHLAPHSASTRAHALLPHPRSGTARPCLRPPDTPVPSTVPGTQLVLGKHRAREWRCGWWA